MDDNVSHTHLTLYIPSELKRLAKASGLNLSAEFTEWIKIRLNQMPIENESIDYEKKAAALKQELSICENKIKAQEEVKNKIEQLENEKAEVLNGIIDRNNALTFPQKPIELLEKTSGIKYFWKQKFNEVISDEEAKEMLRQQLIERGLIDG